MEAVVFAVHYYSLMLAIWLRQIAEYLAWLSLSKPEDNCYSLR